MSSRPPLTDQERAQIRALLRFLVIVLMTVAVASSIVGIVITVFNSGQTLPTLTATP